jgi:hypothetical protein
MKTIDSTYTFRTSISREGYNSKEQSRLCLSAETCPEGKSKMAFKQHSVTISQFAEYATDGYSFCALFSYNPDKYYWIIEGSGRKYQLKPVYSRGKNKGCFRMQFKSEEFFAGTQTIFVDIDLTNYTNVDEYLNSLTYKPTVTYLSFSDNIKKNGVISRRFRMVYVFDTVLDKDVFKRISYDIYKQIEIDTGEPMDDDCGMRYCQYMNGTNHKEIWINNIVYEVSDFPEMPEMPEMCDEMSSWDSITMEELKRSKAEEDDDEYLEILQNITSLTKMWRDDIYKWFTHKWWRRGYRRIINNKSDMPFGDDMCISTEGRDYCALPYYPVKVKDGQKRRKKLINIACGLRKIKPTINKVELIYNLALNAYLYFDNSGQVINPIFLDKVTRDTLLTDEFEYKFNKPKYIVRGDVNKKDIQKVVGEKRTEDTNNTIKKYYNFSKTVKENRKILAENGVFLSESRLYKFLKDMGKKPSKAVTKAGYNPKLSIRENMRILGLTMYQVRKMKEEFENHK